jgi:hypothetical protein
MEFWSLFFVHWSPKNVRLSKNLKIVVKKFDLYRIEFVILHCQTIINSNYTIMTAEFEIYKEGTTDRKITILSKEGELFNKTEKIMKYLFLGYQVTINNNTLEIHLGEGRPVSHSVLLVNNEAEFCGNISGCHILRFL